MGLFFLQDGPSTSGRKYKQYGNFLRDFLANLRFVLFDSFCFTSNSLGCFSRFTLSLSFLISFRERRKAGRKKERKRLFPSSSSLTAIFPRRPEAKVGLLLFYSLLFLCVAAFVPLVFADRFIVCWQLIGPWLTPDPTGIESLYGCCRRVQSRHTFVREGDVMFTSIGGPHRFLLLLVSLGNCVGRIFRCLTSFVFSTHEILTTLYFWIF